MFNRIFGFKTESNPIQTQLQPLMTKKVEIDIKYKCFDEVSKSFFKNPQIKSNKKDFLGRTNYMFLAWSGNYEALQDCILKNPEIKQSKDNVGRTLYHYLALSGNYETLQDCILKNPEIGNFIDINGKLLSSYIKKKFKKIFIDDICSVCLDKLITVVVSLPCGHILHDNCANDLTKQECPYCKQPL